MAGTSPDMTGRVCLITGANSGIGKAATVALARMGATIVMVCRNKEKGEAAQADIKQKSGSSKVELMLADLSSQAAIRQLARDFKSKYNRLDVLLNNAGGMYSPRKTSVDGLELTFALNHLAYFLLTNLLLDELKAAGTPTQMARIINVSSAAHYNGTIHFDDLQMKRHYSEWKAYTQSKLANVMFTYELSRRMQGENVTVNAVHPGIVRSGFAKGNFSFYSIALRLTRPFQISPEQGAITLVYLASSPKVESITGEYFTDKKSIATSAISYHDEAAGMLWDESARLTRLEEK